MSLPGSMSTPQTQSPQSPPREPCSSKPTNPWAIARQLKLPADKINRITGSICNYIIQDLRPFSTIQSPSFRNMLNEMEPKYDPPSRSSLSERIIPAIYAQELVKLTTELGDVKWVSLTSDGWTSRMTEHYLSITAHYIRDWKLKSKVLQTEAVYSSQTGENVAAEITSCLTKFGILDKITLMTVDNARNMEVAAREAGIALKMGCFSHTLNLASNKVYQVGQLVRLLGQMRPIIVFFRRSSVAAAVLKEKQLALQLPVHKLILDSKTRWNSTYMMVERFLEQFPTVTAALLDPRLKKSEDGKRLQKVTDEDIHNGEAFLSVMKAMYTCTLALCSEKKPTAGLVIPMLYKLRKHFSIEAVDTPFIKSLKTAVWKDLETRYKDEDLKEFLEEATCMDPRFKNFIDEDEAWQRLCESALQLYPDSKIIKQEPGEEMPSAATSQAEWVPPTSGHGSVGSGPELPTLEGADSGSEESGPDTKQIKLENDNGPKCALGEFFEDDDDKVEITALEPPVPLRIRCETEVRQYRQLPRIKSTEDPILFWKEHREEFPILSSMALKYLCAQASSVASERVFSTAGDIVTAERSCIDPDNVNMLIFLKKNLEM